MLSQRKAENEVLLFISFNPLSCLGWIARSNQRLSYTQSCDRFHTCSQLSFTKKELWARRIRLINIYKYISEREELYYIDNILLSLIYFCYLKYTNNSFQNICTVVYVYCFVLYWARNLKEYRWTKLPSFLFGVLTFRRFRFKRFDKNEETK